MGKAARLYRKAARQGDAEAYFCLGCLYEKHYHDVSEAIRWYRQAARAGHEKAEECLRLLAGQNPAEEKMCIRDRFSSCCAMFSATS